jgi:hypothetical protein
MRNVREIQQSAVTALFDRFELDAQLLDLLIARPALLLNRGDVETLSFRARNLIARRILLPLQSLDLWKQPTAGVLQRRGDFGLARVFGYAPGVPVPDGVGV